MKPGAARAKGPRFRMKEEGRRQPPGMTENQLQPMGQPGRSKGGTELCGRNPLPLFHLMRLKPTCAAGTRRAAGA